MAEAAEPTVSAEVPEQKAPAAPAEEGYDESLIIKVKGKVKKPERPDDTERNLQVGKLQEHIEKAMARINEIKQIIDSKNSGNRGASPEQQAIQAKMNELRTQWGVVLTQKKRLQTARDDHQTDKEKAMTEARSIRDSIRGPVNLEALDQKLQELDFKLTHESLSAAEEKRLREQKERMERQDRPQVLRYSQLQARIDTAKAAVAELRTQMTALDEQLNSIKAAQDAEKAKMDSLRQKENDQRSDIPGLIVERKECWEVVEALKKKQKEIRDAFEGKWQEFKKLDKAYKGWFAEQRKVRDAQRKAEYEERVAARKARDEGFKVPKYEKEVFQCEQVINYLKALVAEVETKVEAKVAAEAPEPGMKLLKKKDADEESWQGLGSGKKGKGARKAAEKGKVADKSGKKLPHTMETLGTYHKLGVPVPQTHADIPAALEALEAKKKEYEELREKAKDEPEPEEEEVAEEEAAADDEESSKEVVANGDVPHANGNSAETEGKGDVGVTLEVDESGKVNLKLDV